MWRVPEIVPRQQVWVGEDLPEVLQRRARHARMVEKLKPMCCGFVDCDLLDAGDERFTVLLAEVRIRIPAVL